MDPAALFSSVAQMPLPRAAGVLAASGLPVFPVVPDGKRPLTEHGFHESTTDPAQIAAWWRRWPRANIGVPTGHISGLEVVDVDEKPSGSGFPAFDRARRTGLLPGWLALVRTPSGGAHVYFRADPYRAQPSWQAAGAHVDFRGAGGYIVVPPSVVTSGGRRGRYELVGPGQPHPAAVDAKALRDFLDPRPDPAPHRARGPIRSEDAKRLAAWVALRGEGERNRGLFWAACRLAEAGVDPAVTLDALGSAAERAGLPPREVAVTIRSAYRAALAAPRAGAASGQGEAPRPGRRVESQVLS